MILEREHKPEPHAVYRLSTSAWSNKGVHSIKRTLRYMKRMSCEDSFEHDVSAVGTLDAMAMITNFDACPDGLYILKIIDLHRDWETGAVEEWSYKLIPYEGG